MASTGTAPARVSNDPDSSAPKLLAERRMRRGARCFYGIATL